MKKIAMVVCFLAVLTPSVFAQVVQPPFESVIVGENNPSSGGEGAHIAQEFALSSGAFVNRVDLGLYAVPDFTQLGATCTFSIAIVDSLGPGGSLGSILLQRDESVVITRLGLFSFSDTFEGIFLPSGSHYLFLNTLGGQSVCGPPDGRGSVLWAFNADGSSKVGTVGQSFGESNNSWGPAADLTFAFDLDGPILLPPPTGGGIGQIARLVVEGPVMPPPGGPVQAQLGFLDISGNAIGPTSTVTLNPGQIQSLDLNLSEFARLPGQRIEVRPVITQVPDAAGAPSSPTQLSASVQVLDALTGFGTVLNPVPQPGASVPALGPQVLAGGQTMRVNVVAYPPDPCIAQVSFTDKNGNPIGSTLPVNLGPGMGTSLDLNADTLGLRFGQRIEVQPVVTVEPLVGGAAVTSVCQSSSEVFDHLLGRTWSYQSSLAALPAVQ
jgi:hypothetical protein